MHLTGAQPRPQDLLEIQNGGRGDPGGRSGTRLRLVSTRDFEEISLGSYNMVYMGVHSTVGSKCPPVPQSRAEKRLRMRQARQLSLISIV